MSMEHTSWDWKPAATSAATSAPAEVPATRWKTAPRSSITDRAPDSAMPLTPPPSKTASIGPTCSVAFIVTSPRIWSGVPGTYVKDRGIVVGTWSGALPVSLGVESFYDP